MELEEVHRFPNGMTEKDGELVWDVDELFAQIKLGMKKCGELGKIPVSVGVDTWGVDFVLLDGEGNRIGNAVAYRDGRTRGMDEEVYKRIPEDELYARTGIQKAIINTIYQLMALKTRKPEQLEKAETLLTMPDYFHYLLSGVAVTEYTEATTGQLVSPVTKDWDMELIERLGYPKRIFRKIVVPGTEIGRLTESVKAEHILHRFLPHKISLRLLHDHVLDLPVALVGQGLHIIHQRQNPVHLLLSGCPVSVGFSVDFPDIIPVFHTVVIDLHGLQKPVLYVLL